MSKGFLVFAENTSATDYVQQAYALALSIKYTQKEVTNISLMTNERVPKKYQKVFDKIIPVPWSEHNVESRYKAEHRWKLFHVTPYEETIILDTDMLFLEDVSDWWNYCKSHDLKFCSRIRNYKLETIENDTYHRLAFIENNLTNPYYALHYFKKSETALNFYKTLEFVCNNWEWFYDKFAPIAYQNKLSMDLAAAIAIEVTGYYEAVNDCVSPLEFVHMKSPIQNWLHIPMSWQDAIHYVLNLKGDLVVGNIKQPKLFHYVEKNFISKKLLQRIEEIANGNKKVNS